MFISMVVSAGKRGMVSQNTRMYEQRFNVAMSRARDRVYLYHSCTIADVPAQDLKARLLHHFEQGTSNQEFRPAENIGKFAGQIKAVVTSLLVRVIHV